VQTCTEPCTTSCTEPCTLSGQSNKENKEELKKEPKEEIIIYKQENIFLELLKEMLENIDFIEKLKNKYNIENVDIKNSAEKFLIYRTEKNPN
jgi:predicted ribosome-associated RNA-binding protein Tma20